MPAIEPSSRDHIKDCGGEFCGVGRVQSIAIEQTSNGGGKDGDEFSSRRGLRLLERFVFHTCCPGAQLFHKRVPSAKRQSFCLESYLVRAGDDGKRVASETGCSLGKSGSDGCGVSALTSHHLTEKPHPIPMESLHNKCRCRSAEKQLSRDGTIPDGRRTRPKHAAEQKTAGNSATNRHIAQPGSQRPEKLECTVLRFPFCVFRWNSGPRESRCCRCSDCRPGSRSSSPDLLELFQGC